MYSNWFYWVIDSITFYVQQPAETIYISLRLGSNSLVWTSFHNTPILFIDELISDNIIHWPHWFQPWLALFDSLCFLKKKSFMQNILELTIDHVLNCLEKLFGEGDIMKNHDADSCNSQPTNRTDQNSTKRRRLSPTDASDSSNRGE